jgi:hypothetical protein
MRKRHDNAAGAVDFVYDGSRDTLYITRNDQVLRYSVGGASFLPPFELGGDLSGLDLSPDGNELAVADKSYDADTTWFYLIDLPTGNARKFFLPRTIPDVPLTLAWGTYSVAFGNDGGVLVTGYYPGTGMTPLYWCQPGTGAYKVLKLVTDSTVANSTADKGVIGFAEGNISDGRWGRFRVSDGDLVERTGYDDGTGAFDTDVGVSRDGRQISIPTYSGTFVYDENFTKIATVGVYAGPQPVGVVYDPNEDVVYFSWSVGMQIRAYYSRTLTMLRTFDVGSTWYPTTNYTFWLGRLRISPDSSLIFTRVSGGIFYVRTNEPLTAFDQTVVTDAGKSVPVILTGCVGSRLNLSYVVTQGPQHGTLTGAPPNLTYTPAADYAGKDSFSFAIHYGPASAPATVSLAVGALASQGIPQITGVIRKGKKLVVSGDGFHAGATIMVGGVQQDTVQSSGTTLKGLHFVQLLRSSGSFVIQVRNSDGTLSNTVVYTAL